MDQESCPSTGWTPERRARRRALRRRRQAFGGLGLLAALVVGGCGGGPSVTVTHAVGSLGVANGGAIAPTGADWRSLMHGASHFGASVATGPSASTVRWQRQLGGPIVPGPVTVGRVAYVATDAGVLHAISLKSGADEWTFGGGARYGSDLSTSPTVLADGTVLWPGPRNRLFALTPQGRLRWALSAAGQPLTPAVNEARGQLVLADDAGNLTGYRLGSGGGVPVRLWSRSLAATSFGNPALGADGTIYETAGDSLFAVAPAGQVRWQVRTSDAVEVSAAVAQDGTVVFGSNDQQEYGVASDGKVLWRHPIGTLTYSSPVTLAGDRVVFGNHHGEMTILDTRDGHVVATDRASGLIWTAAAVDAHGDVYFASRNGGIYGFGPGGRALFTIRAGGSFDSYPAIAADGTLLVGGDDGVLRAIGGGATR